MQKQIGWVIGVTAAVLAIVAMAKSSGRPPSAGEQAEAARLCGPYGGLKEARGCIPPEWCRCRDESRHDYRGEPCGRVCATHRGVGTFGSAFSRWTGGIARCADGGEFSLSLDACEGYRAEGDIKTLQIEPGGSTERPPVLVVPQRGLQSIAAR